MVRLDIDFNLAHRLVEIGYKFTYSRGETNETSSSRRSKAIPC